MKPFLVNEDVRLQPLFVLAIRGEDSHLLELIGEAQVLPPPPRSTKASTQFVELVAFSWHHRPVQPIESRGQALRGHGRGMRRSSVQGLGPWLATAMTLGRLGVWLTQ